MNTHSGAVGGGGQPIAHDDSRDASTNAAIKKPTVVFMGGSSPTPVSSTDSSPAVRMTVLGVCLPVLRGRSDVVCVRMVNAYPDACGG
jgi:hypothetical protein